MEVERDSVKVFGPRLLALGEEPQFALRSRRPWFFVVLFAALTAWLLPDRPVLAAGSALLLVLTLWGHFCGVRAVSWLRCERSGITGFTGEGRVVRQIEWPDVTAYSLSNDRAELKLKICGQRDLVLSGLDILEFERLATLVVNMVLEEMFDDTPAEVLPDRWERATNHFEGEVRLASLTITSPSFDPWIGSLGPVFILVPLPFAYGELLRGAILFGWLAWTLFLYARVYSRIALTLGGLEVRHRDSRSLYRYGDIMSWESSWFGGVSILFKDGRVTRCPWNSDLRRILEARCTIQRGPGLKQKSLRGLQ